MTETINIKEYQNAAQRRTHSRRSNPEEVSSNQKETSEQMKETSEQMKETDKRLKKAENLFTTQWGRLMESLVEGDLHDHPESTGNPD